jgi:FixJ family two-component response regulator
LLDRITQSLEQAHRRRERRAARASVSARLALLTPREGEVLQDVLAGKPNKVIAAERGISQKTVEAHRARIMQKLQARSLAGLLQMAMQHASLGRNPDE